MQVFTLIKVGVEKHNLSDSSPEIFTKTLQNNHNSMPNTQSSNRKQILLYIAKKLNIPKGVVTQSEGCQYSCQIECYQIKLQNKMIKIRLSLLSKIEIFG